MADVVIFGLEQLAELALVYLTHDSPHRVVAFTVDREFVKGPTFHDRPVVPFDEVQQQYPPDQCSMLLPISYQQVNRLRAAKYHEAKAKGYALISYVSSKAVTWPGLQVGDNCFILEQNVIQPFAEIGNNVILWSGNHIGHHSRISDHCFVASHVVISGNVLIEPYCFLGVNATIRDGVTVAAETIVGAGALILKNTRPRSVHVGTRATVFPRTSDQLKDL